MEKKVYQFENKRVEKFNYLLHTVENQEKLPLIISLHGAGERGDEFDKLYVHGIPKYINRGLNVDAIVAAPQCPNGWIWNNLTVELKEFIDYIVSEYNVDTDRITITGLSMGGYGTWEMIVSYPEFFAAAAPICGGGVSWRVGAAVKTPVWAFHGDIDQTVPINNSMEMCDRLKASGGNVKFTIFHNIAHNSWEPAYEDTNVINWLLKAHK